MINKSEITFYCFIASLIIFTLGLLFDRFKNREKKKHDFNLDDLELTGFDPLKEPDNNDYDEWAKYYSEIYNHKSHTMRVKWPCRKCGEVFYAHCGIDILNKRGCKG